MKILVHNMFQKGALISVLICVCFAGIFSLLSTEEQVGRQYSIAVVLDTSLSMNAFDMPQDASRLEYAKFLIQNYILPLQSEKSLTIFAGETREILPFTSAIDLYATFLKNIYSDNIAIQGTVLKDAIEVAAERFGDERGGKIYVFTDGGEERVKRSYALEQLLHSKGVELVIVGLGSKQGAYIPVGVTPFGDVMYKTYKGQRVVTKLDTSMMKENTKNLGGRYIHFSNISDELFESYTGKVGYHLLQVLSMFLAAFLWVLYILSLLYTRWIKR